MKGLGSHDVSESRLSIMAFNNRGKVYYQLYIHTLT